MIMKGNSYARVLDFNPNYSAHFERLNREWIEKYFEIEPRDIKCFSDPKKSIIDAGGDVIFAELNGEVVGTCALLYEDGVYELAKLAVTDSAKGKGIGKLLSLEIIRRARAKGARRLILTTNSRLKAAVDLYEKLGFHEIFRGEHPKYQRVDLVMEKDL
jgi:GNAT superfamily N-acetyltransferase